MTSSSLTRSSVPATATAAAMPTMTNVAVAPGLDRGRLEQASATEIVAWAKHRFGDGLCLATSFTDTVLIDIAHHVDADIPVFFADTGFHFPETLDTMKQAQVEYKLDLRVVRPAPDAPDLWANGPEACCGARKVTPLLSAMQAQGFVAWLSGLRRAESPLRADKAIVEVDGRGLTKVNPLANWSDDDVDGYKTSHRLVTNALTEQGYPSVGCWPCTEPAGDGDPRSGRWAGSTKTECGLHLPSPNEATR